MFTQRKNLRETLRTTLGCVVVVVALVSGLGVQNAAGAFIHGEIDMLGVAELNGPPNTATALLAGLLQETTVGTGDYSAVPPFTSMTLNPFAFPIPPGPAVAPLWSFTIGATTYSFDLTSLGITGQGVGANGIPYLNLEGMGVAHITGFDDTPAAWTLTTQGGLPLVSFSASTIVPEPATILTGVLLLLPLGLRAIRLLPHRQ